MARGEGGASASQEAAPLLMWSLMRAFFWFDRGMQENIAARGLEPLSRTESLIMLLTAAGVTRPTEISKSLGLSRQAINQTINQLVEKRLVVLSPDPADRRCKVVEFSEDGGDMRRNGREILAALEAHLRRNLGEDLLEALHRALEADWGAPPLVKR